jgi:protein ImuA
MQRFALPDPRPRLAEARRRVRAIEARGLATGTTARPPVLLGADAIDAALGGGLRRDAAHEIAPAGRDAQGAATGFAARLAAAAAGGQGRTAWVMAVPDLFPPGLEQAGLVPARLLFVAAPDMAQRLMAIEEAAGACATVVGEVALAGEALMRATRRLQLVAERTGAFILLLAPREMADPSAVATRWRVAPAPSPLPQVRALHPGAGGVGLGPMCLRLDLWRAKGLAGERCWVVECGNGGCSDGGCSDGGGISAGFSLVPGLERGPLPARGGAARWVAAG